MSLRISNLSLALAIALPCLALAPAEAASPIAVTFDSAPALDGSGLTSVFAGLPGVTVIDFNNTPLGSNSVLAAGITITGDGAVVIGSVVNQYAAPPGDTTRYLTLALNSPVGHETISFTTPVNYFGYYWGSMDSYNFITFHLQNAADVVLSGNDVALMGNANGNQSAAATNRYTNYFATDAAHLITGIELLTTNYAMESDNWAFGTVPEPGTVALMAAGLLGLGLMRRRATG